MGDVDGAKEILREVISEGTREQMKEAKTLLETIDQVSD
jgi:FimV-like protein